MGRRMQIKDADHVPILTRKHQDFTRVKPSFDLSTLDRYNHKISKIEAIIKITVYSFQPRIIA
ncbi:hypothetical protein YC2023_011181 [Brassica napus]